MDTTKTGKLDHVALYIGTQTILHHCIKNLAVENFTMKSI